MAERLDICAGRKYTDRDGKEKTQWTKIGILFPSKSGEGYSGTLEFLPLTPDEKGGVRIACFPQRDRKDGGGSGRSSGGTNGGYSDEDYGAKPDDDEIPF